MLIPIRSKHTKGCPYHTSGPNMGKKSIFYPKHSNDVAHSRQTFKKRWFSPNFDRPWEYIGGNIFFVFLADQKKGRSFLKSFYLVLFIKVYFGKRSILSSAFKRYIWEVHFIQCFLRYILKKFHWIQCFLRYILGVHFIQCF